jgi:elongation factor 1-beta
MPISGSASGGVEALTDLSSQKSSSSGNIFHTSGGRGTGAADGILFILREEDSTEGSIHQVPLPEVRGDPLQVPQVQAGQQSVQLSQVRLRGTLGLFSLAKLNVIAQFRVMPTDIDVDLDDLLRRIEASLPQNTKLEVHRQDDIAYGLKALVMNILMEDKAGGTTPVEESIEAQEGVESVEVVGVTRI